jgi:hypothetical protein
MRPFSIASSLPPLWSMLPLAVAFELAARADFRR